MSSPTWPTLAAFALASLVLAATPGPGVVYIVTRTLAQGRRAGLASIAGVALGNLGNATVASLAFTLVKFAGAAYLVWLGIQALRAREPRAVAPAAPPQAPRHGRILRDGVMVALLNPKTALFFAAFLPQFIDPAGSAALQSMLFGAAFVSIAACSDTGYVLAAAAVAPALRGAGRWRARGRVATALVYFGLGAFTALSDPRPR